MLSLQIDASKQLRKNYQDDAAKILTAARTENRALTPVEQHQLQALEDAISDATAEIETRLAESARPDSTAVWQAELARRTAADNPHLTAGSTASASTTPVTAASTTLTRSQKVADWSKAVERTGDGPDYDIGKMVRGLAIGDWTGAEIEKRVMSEGTLTAGGHMVPTPLAANVIDLARNKMRVIQAGAQTVPMTSQTLKIARLTADPTASWKTENATVTASDAAMDAVTLTAQALTVLVRLSMELIEDAPNIGQAVSDAIAAAIALEFDRVALRGSGTAPEPRGIRNQTGVTITANGANGTAANYDQLIDAFQVVRAGNYEPTGVIAAPRLEQSLSKLKDSTGQYLRAPDAVNAIPRYATNQVPTNLTVGTSVDTSEVYVGDFSQLLIGLRTQLSISLLSERYLADNGQVAFFAYLRGDIQLARGTAFNVLTGIRP